MFLCLEETLFLHLFNWVKTILNTSDNDVPCLVLIRKWKKILSNCPFQLKNCYRCIAMVSFSIHFIFFDFFIIIFVNYFNIRDFRSELADWRLFQNNTRIEGQSKLLPDMNLLVSTRVWNDDRLLSSKYLPSNLPT